MEFFQKHAPKIALAATALWCAAIVAVQEHDRTAGEPPDSSREIAAVRRGLRTHPSSAYPYVDEASASFDFNSAGARPELKSVAFGEIAQHTAYPVPSRPRVGAPPAGDPETIEERAVLGEIKSFSLSAAPGRIVLGFDAPELKFMTLLRVEIFRDQGAPGSSTTPLASIKIGDAGAQTFADTDIEPRKSYAYRLRAVGRMNIEPDVRKPGMDAAGKAILRVVRTPENAQRSAAALEFSGPLSAPRSITSASNCEVRFSGLIGEISAEGVPAERRRTDYKATFSIRVWTKREWKVATLQAAPGEQLKGSVLMRNAAARAENFEFDTELQLVEVKWGRIRPKPGATESESESFPNETAVLRDLSTGALTEFPKRGAAR